MLEQASFFESTEHNPGGKTVIRLPAFWRSPEVEFGGPNKCYRYKAIYRWDDGPIALFLMKNPSIADAVILDPTVAKVGRLAKRWGYAGFAVANTSPYRSTNPQGLRSISDPFGEPRNSAAILEMAAASALIVMAHGKLPTPELQAHARYLTALLVQNGFDLYYLRLLDGEIPIHPLARGLLNVPEDCKPTFWRTGQRIP